MNYISLKEISEKDVGKEFYVIVQVRSIRQTSGPTVFELKDNSGVMRATAFSRAGERAFPKIIPGENIQALVNVKKRLNDIELEIVKYDKINQSVLTPVNLEKKPFLIHSENLE